MAEKIIVLQHVAPEGLGAIADLLSVHGLEHENIRIHEGAVVPESIGDAPALIVMGGPMGVYEQEIYPHLKREIKLIESALKERRPILGICLGSQLLAHALGANVRPGKQKEIGWYDVQLADGGESDPLCSSAPPSFKAFHWHGDVFDLPSGAARLASSKLTENQAFRHGTNAYGILFHMEVTSTIVDRMCADFADEARAAGADPKQISDDVQQHLTPLQLVGREIFNGWAKLVASH